MCWTLAGRRATDEFPGRIVRTHFCCKPDGMLAAVRVSDRTNCYAGDEIDGGPCGWHLVSVQGPQGVFSVGPPKRAAPWLQIELTLLPLTFPDDDAPRA